MTPDFSSAMRAVAKLTRAQKLMEATRLIQIALSHQQAPALNEQGEPMEHVSNDKLSRLRKPLAEVISTLRRAKQYLEPAARKTGKILPVPEGAQFLSGSFTCRGGSRDYRLYIPSLHKEGRRALVVMLHGCKQDPVDFAIGTRMNAVAEEHGMFVLYPHQPPRANPMSCWNWFSPKDQIRDAGEPGILGEMTRHVINLHNIDPQKVFVAGLSAGGAMAAVLGATYPDIYAAIGVHSGLPYQVANDVISAFAAMRGEANGTVPRRIVPRIRTIVFHGDADQIVHPSNAANIIAAQSQAGDAMELELASDQTYTRKITSDLNGKIWNEHWLVHGVSHGWSGGSSEGSFTDARGPNASREMVRFFLD